MNGTERLRELASSITFVVRAVSDGHTVAEAMYEESPKLSDRLRDIADQIEREQDKVARTDWKVVREVAADMADRVFMSVTIDGLLRDWSRKLTDAADGHERAADVSMSAYDLLPPDEREAIAWVRKHGGLDYVRAEWRSRVPYDRYVARRQRLLGQIAECKTALGRRNDRIEELGRRVNDLTTENAELRKRAMPEGMEWPRFEDGEPVRVGDEFACWCGEVHEVASVTLRDGRSIINESQPHSFVVSDGPFTAHGERVKRPAPKVLDADGAEIRAGDTVWVTNGHGPFEVTRIVDSDQLRVIADDEKNGHLNAVPKNLTHRAPVLAADGRPLREGETVYRTNSTTAFVVDDIMAREDGADVVHLKGGAWHLPQDLTHERPDSWEQLEEDVKMEPREYCVEYDLMAAYMGGEAEEYAKAADLVRRARALAERDGS